jgi:hypothetical protein
MRHFSLFDGSDDEPIRKKADSEKENTYYTIDFENREGLMGLLSIIQFASILLGVDQEKLNPLTDYIANAISSDDNTIRLNAEELDTLINAYNKTWDLYEEIGEEEFINQWGSIVDESGSGLDDMIVAGDAMFDAKPEPSSMADLENIPTMEKNPEDLAEGENPMGSQAEDIFGEVPELSEAPEYNPEGESRPPLFEGWQFERNPALDKQEDIPHSIPPATPAGQANMLQKHFDIPAVEHPLGPDEGFDPRKASEEESQEFYTSGGFVKGPDGKWLVAINPSGGQREPMPGDWAEIVQRTKSFNRPVPLTLVEDMGGAWSFKNGHHPSI